MHLSIPALCGPDISDLPPIGRNDINNTSGAPNAARADIYITGFDLCYKPGINLYTMYWNMVPVTDGKNANVSGSHYIEYFPTSLISLMVVMAC